MLSYKPDTRFEKELRIIQGRLAEVRQGLGNLRPGELDYLRHCALISTIGASTRIENALLTDAEIDWVDTALTREGRPTAFDENRVFILDKLSKDKERSVEEVVGCREVLSTVFSQADDMFPLTETAIRGLHHDLLRHHPPALNYAGKYKTSTNQVTAVNHATGAKHAVLDPAPPGIVTETAMADLVKWYNIAIREHAWPLLVATEFVFRFLSIHPFHDGNGRLGRALYLMALLQADDGYLGEVIPCVSIDREIERNRTRYYSVLAAASGGKFDTDPSRYNYGPLAIFLLKCLNDSLNDIVIYRQRFADLTGLSETAREVLEAFKSHPERRLKASVLVEMTGRPRRTVQYALRTLVGKGFLQPLGKGAGSRYQLVF